VVVIGPVFGWLLKTVFDRLRRLEEADSRLAEKVGELAVALPTHYVTKPDHNRALNDIFNALRRIEEKLDGKADKP
jgi:hypothetical protein